MINSLLPTGPVASLRTPRISLFRKIMGNPVALIAIGFLLLVSLAAILAPVLTSYNPNTADLRSVLAPVSAEHPLGADSAGRDVWARLLFATRFSILGALLALAVATAIGVTAGLIAGYYGKWFDTVSSWFSGLLMSLPAIIVLLAARSVLNPSMWVSMIIFGILISPACFRLVYASVTAVRDELYVDAARVSGLSDVRIIARHILTVVRAPVIIQAASITGIAISIQAGLEFLGLGDSNIPTWGSMLNDGFANIYSEPLLMLWPSLAIGTVSIALTLFANCMRDELEGGRQSPAKAPPRAAAPVVAVTREPVVRHDDPTGGSQFGEELLRVENLAVGYGQADGTVKNVVNDVSLIVRRGEVHGLIGESGSGKTQTAWSILGLLPKGGRVVGGSILFEGTNLATASRSQLTKLRGKSIAYIPQEPMSNLDASFTIGSQMVEPMMVCLKISRAEAKKRALELLGKVGIPNPKLTYAAYPHQISGGMAQRILIAGAISCKPQLLIADEPTTALDVTVQAEVLDLLRSLQQELHMGVVLVTHNFGVVADLCDTVSVMRAGRVVETGPVVSIFSDPQHDYTRALFASILEESEPRGPLTSMTRAGLTSEGAEK